MRMNSSKAGKILMFVYILCILIFLFDLIILNIEGSFRSLSGVSPIALAVLLFIVYRGLPQFLYDSDGEVLNFTAQEPNLGFMGKSFVRHFEFPKRKLHNYKILRYPLKRKLVVYISSKKDNVKKQSMSISYLSSRQVRDLRRSLDKVLVTNRKKKNGRRK